MIAPPQLPDESVSDQDDVWTFDGDDVRLRHRRHLLTAHEAELAPLLSAAHKLGRQEASDSAAPRSPDREQLIASFRTMLEHTRELGQKLAPSDLLPMLPGPIRVLRRVAEHSQGEDRAAMMLLAAQFAEYIGRLAQEVCDHQGALWWAARAAEYSAIGRT